MTLGQKMLFKYAFGVGLALTAAGAALALRGEPGAVAPPASGSGSPDTARSFPVTIQLEERITGVEVPAGANGERAVAIACGTCHATRPPNADNRRTADLDQFHQGLKVSHGGAAPLACLACHARGDYDRLQLADGSPIGFPDRQRLCEQCHGPTARDYARGAHGGMAGYWDLGRGPRIRNGCTACHDPHAPAYPAMKRTFWTKDRGPGEPGEANRPGAEGASR